MSIRSTISVIAATAALSTIGVLTTCTLTSEPLSDPAFHPSDGTSVEVHLHLPVPILHPVHPTCGFCTL